MVVERVPLPGEIHGGLESCLTQVLGYLYPSKYRRDWNPALHMRWGVLTTGIVTRRNTGEIGIPPYTRGEVSLGRISLPALLYKRDGDEYQDKYNHPKDSQCPAFWVERRDLIQWLSMEPAKEQNQKGPE